MNNCKLQIDEEKGQSDLEKYVLHLCNLRDDVEKNIAEASENLGKFFADSYSNEASMYEILYKISKMESSSKIYQVANNALKSGNIYVRHICFSINGEAFPVIISDKLRQGIKQKGLSVYGAEYPNIKEYLESQPQLFSSQN